MLNKFFKNKFFIFILSFVLSALVYYMVIILQVSGKFQIPDTALAPILGLMFGPIGGLGQFFATFILDIHTGHDAIISFFDSLGLLFISVLSYKLWYSIFKGKKLGVPRFNSYHNILKFILIMAIASFVYVLWINLLFKLNYTDMSLLYASYNYLNRFVHGFRFFNYSIIYGFLFITVFNYFKIPFYAPLNKKVFGDINPNYFIWFLIFILAYIAINFVFNFNWVIDMVMVILTVSTLIIYFINSIDVDLNLVFEDYSIIEKIIFVFIVLISISLFVLYNDILSLFNQLSALGFNIKTISLISMSASIIILLLLVIIHIRSVEKVLTNPINELTDAINEYSSNKKQISQQYFNLKFNKYMKNNDDVSNLLKSFMHLSDSIKKNLDKIRDTTIEKERFETEFNVASKIQAHMLPTNFEEFSQGKGFEIYAYMNPAREVGGDFYDYFDIDEDNISFVIGDVSGKGIPATLFMVKTMHLIKNHSYFNDELSKVFYNVNNLSCQRNDEELFVTSWMGKFNFRSGELYYVNAGHNQPLIRQNNGDFEYWDMRPNLVLGGMEDVPYKEHTLNFKPGDMIFLYTDGVTEANNDYQGFYGEDRLKETINRFKDESLSNIITKIKEDVNSFCDNHDQFDDVTMVILKYNGWDGNE